MVLGLGILRVWKGEGRGEGGIFPFSLFLIPFFTVPSHSHPSPTSPLFPLSPHIFKLPDPSFVPKTQRFSNFDEVPFAPLSRSIAPLQSLLYSWIGPYAL